jgi:toxin ParE1/3/4
MRVVWTPQAQEQLRAIHDYVAAASPVRARHLVDRLTSRSKQIAEHPQSGRKVPELDLPQIREVIERPYRIVYRIKSGQIDVIAVLHGAMQSPWTE